MIPEAGGLLQRFASMRDAEVFEFHQHDIEPTGDGFIIGFGVTLGVQGAFEKTHIYINTSSDAAVDDQSARLQRPDGTDTIVWEYPADPSLPALTAMSFPEAAGQTLAKFGIEAKGATLTLEAYRPGKRAVFRIDTDGGRFFAKLVHPKLAASIDARHHAFLAAGMTVPVSLGYSDSGLLLLDRLPGESAVAHVRSIGGDPRFLQSLDALAARIAAVPVQERARASLAARVGWYGARMREQAPMFAAAADALIPVIEAQYRASPPASAVTIHGDMHLGQIFVDPAEPWRITGVLDIDTAGLGEQADDGGALYGHVCVSAAEARAAGDEASGASFTALAAAIRQRFLAPRVRAIAATHLLGHALASGSRATERGQQVASWLLADARSLTSMTG